jgi:hypothetical protein
MTNPNFKPTTVPVRLPSGKISSAIRHKAVTPAPGPGTPSAGPVTKSPTAQEGGSVNSFGDGLQSAYRRRRAFIHNLGYGVQDAEFHLIVALDDAHQPYFPAPDGSRHYFDVVPPAERSETRTVEEFDELFSELESATLAPHFVWRDLNSGNPSARHPGIGK